MSDLNFVPPEHLPLGGEAHPGLYGFEDEAGKPMAGGEAILPILVQRNSSNYELVGTGFFITDFGVFVTAKHVLEKDHECGHKFFIWQLIPPDHWDIIPVDQVNMHQEFDLAVGVVSRSVNKETGEELIHTKLPLSLAKRNKDDLVVTYAYPNTVIDIENHVFSFKPDFYEGRITECFPSGRDISSLPGPCYQTNMRIHHGASGGPVACSENGKVFAVNTSGLDGVDFHISYVSQIDPILGLTLMMPGEQGPEEVTIQELAELGYVAIDK
ncbi:MAG: trypsin-like peptidase domain-containing protein [Nitrospira sp.]|nr:trypsin-like peptidase domain-containing protein [Nitrospira sp.]